jgi:beta-glucuronidase
LDGPKPPRSALLEIPTLKLRGTIPLREGCGTAEFPADPVRWSPERPKLYAVRLSAGSDRVSDSIGFRTVSVEGRRVLLNGNPVFLRGISLHEERPTEGGGRTLSDAEIKKMLGQAKALGCNFLRLAHYPHAEQTVKLAERMGFMLWVEAPIYWGVQFANPATLANCKSQLREMIWRDYNRASVITWSVGNETPNFPERDRFFEALIRQTRALDRTRLVSAAFVVERGRDEYQRGIFSRIARRLDLTGINQYFGWYELNEKDDLERVNWDVSTLKKPVIFSEFGAEALAGRHGRSGERWTEEDQADVYRRQVRMISRLDWCAGTTPWLLTDFRSTWRAGRHQNGYNRKGVLAHNLRRKLAFDVLREFYEQKRRQCAVALGAEMRSTKS